jgi:hypothetical protein
LDGLDLCQLTLCCLAWRRTLGPEDECSATVRWVRVLRPTALTPMERAVAGMTLPGDKSEEVARVGLFRRMSGITVRMLGCGALVAAVGGAGRAEAQAQVPDLRGCSGALATRFLKQQRVPFDVVGDASMVVVGQDGDASHVTLVFEQGGLDDVGPSLPECSVVSVPDVVGLELADAVDAIVKSGLTQKAEGTGTVEEQDPRGRSIVERGTTVSLVLATGEPAGEQPGGVAGEAGGTGAGGAELPAGEAPAVGGDAPTGDEPAGGSASADEPAGDEPAGDDQPAGAESADPGEPGGDSPGADANWQPTVALAGAIGGTLAVALALLLRARPGWRRRTAVNQTPDEPPRPHLPARVRLVPHDVADVVTAPDGGPLVSVTASLDKADLAVRVEEGVSS